MWINRRLERKALYAMGETYTRILKINYTTGKWKFIRDDGMDTENVKGATTWKEFHAGLLKKVHPDSYEMYKNFISLDNMKMVAKYYPGGEMCIFRKARDGEYKWIRVLLIPLKDKRNKDCVLICARDVEESVKAEEYRKSMMLENLQKAKKADAQKADLLKYLAYDLYTPMDAVIKMSELAEAAVKSGNMWEATYYMERVGKMASYTYGVINDVVRRGALQESHLEINIQEFDIKNLLAACKEYAASLAGEDVTFEIVAEDSLAKRYKGDELRIKQVLFNLLSNAFKFNRIGGSVKLRAYASKKKEKDDKVIFVVEDTGCGIGGEFLPELFEFFARESRDEHVTSKGVGFGLAYAKSVAEALDADIKVETTPGEGSCFAFSLWMERSAQ